MSLATALDGAFAGISVTSAQMAVVSRNIANQSNPAATRKIANVVTGYGGLPVVSSISRTADSALSATLLSANSNQSQQSAISNSLTQLQSTLGTASSSNSSSYSQSPSALIEQLSSSLQSYAAAPQNLAGGQAAVQAAQNLADGLNSASAAVQNVREQADQGMASSVTTINNLLSQFTQLNNTIISGSQSGADVSDAEDQRDKVLQQLSGQIGITTVTRANNDVAIYTDSGVTLFDKTARTVTFNPTSDFSATTQGNAVYADGVPITAQGSPMSIHSGALAGLAAIRDQIAPTYESQLDEVARGLINQFQETDQSGSNSPATPQAGLFTNGSSLAVPASGTVVPGLAATIQVSANAIADPTLLRDGGISTNGQGVYVYNSGRAQGTGTGYTTRLNQLISNLSQPMTFDSSAEAGQQASVSDYADASASWLGAQVQQASANTNYSATVQNAASSALSNATGVNLDTELSNMLVLEQSYQASAKLMSAVNTLYTALFQAA
jgi:flagellar hook-associated protein 1 FlgK